MSNENKPKFYDFVNVYDFTCEMPGSKETIQFKPVTTGQIKKLLTYENETNIVVQEQALDDLISSSVLTEGFNIDDQYLYDRLYLLIEIRKKTKGEILEFQVKCPECNSQSLNRVNLENLDVIPLENTDDVVVELGRVKVHLRHMKRKHQKEDIKPQLFPKNLSDSQKAYMYQVAFHACAINKIETPNGIDEDIPMRDRIYFIESIPMSQMEILKDKLDEMAFGWKLENKIKCNHCTFEYKADIPVQQNFFG
jgi:hypothetical protein